MIKVHSVTHGHIVSETAFVCICNDTIFIVYFYTIFIQCANFFLIGLLESRFLALLLFLFCPMDEKWHTH